MFCTQAGACLSSLEKCPCNDVFKPVDYNKADLVITLSKYVLQSFI